MKLYYLINLYLNDLKQNDMSPCTIKTFKNGLNQFVKFCESDIDVEEIDKLMIKEYKFYLGKKDLTNKTINRYLIALRNLIIFCKKNEIKIIDKELIELSQEHQRDVVYLNNEEIKMFLQAPEYEREGAKKYRDLATLHLLYGCGIRRDELSNLKVDDIDMERGEVKIHGKGRKIRLGFLTKTAKKFLKKYLKYRDEMNVTSEYLIQSVNCNKAERLSPNAIRAMVTYYSEKAGIKKRVTPHTLRHTFATHLLKNGADISSVQRLLGHRYVTTTQIYIHLDTPHLRKQHHLLEK